VVCLVVCVVGWLLWLVGWLLDVVVGLCGWLVGRAVGVVVGWAGGVNMSGMMRDILAAQNISLKIYLSNCNYNNYILAPSDLHHPLIIPSSSRMLRARRQRRITSHMYGATCVVRPI
jgi:hypothetical protein